MVKHLKRCGGGSVKDVIDESKLLRPSFNLNNISPEQHNTKRELSSGPPNVTVIAPTDSNGDPSNEPGTPSNGNDDSCSNDAYTCEECMYTASSVHDFQEHMMMHDLGGQSSPNASTCHLCPFKASGDEELTRHLKLHENVDKPFTCLTCGYSSKWKCDLKKHCKTHAHEPMTSLEDARRKSQNGSDEVGDKDEEGGDEVAGFRCNLCDFVGETFRTFLQHKLLHENVMERSFASGSCDVSSRPEPNIGSRRKQSKQNIMKHRHVMDEQAAATASPVASGLSHDQPQQLSSVTAQQQLISTFNISPNMSPVLSPVTGKPVYSEGKKTKRRLKQCTKCAYITDNVTTLQRHMAKHGKQGRFTCPHCDYSVDKQHVIDYHVKNVHTAEGSSRVNSPMETDATSNSTVDLSERASPDSVGNLSEKVDSPPSPVRADLVKIIHIGNRVVYACRRCVYTTANLSEVNAHVEKHGANGSHTCTHCDYSVHDEALLRAHEREVHDDVTIPNDNDDVIEPKPKRPRLHLSGSESAETQESLD